MLRTENLSFQYGDGFSLENISFEAKAGQITSIIGANGAGKTTLLKCIAGLHKSSGLVEVNGVDARFQSWSETFAQIGYLDQSTDLGVDLTVFEVILLGRLRRLSFHVSDEDIERVNRTMELMNITKYAGRKISALSGGQRQLVFIAQTLIKEPKILILDEPTSALDLNRQFRLMDFLKDITHEKNYATVMTLHHLDLAAQYSDHVVVVTNGRLYGCGSPGEMITSRMLRDVYEVEAEIYKDRNGNRHIASLGPCT